MTVAPGDCSFQFNPTGTAKFTNSCDIAKAQLAAHLGELHHGRRRQPARSPRSRSATTSTPIAVPTTPRKALTGGRSCKAAKADVREPTARTTR